MPLASKPLGIDLWLFLGFKDCLPNQHQTKPFQIGRASLSQKQEESYKPEISQKTISKGSQALSFRRFQFFRTSREVQLENVQFFHPTKTSKQNRIWKRSSVLMDETHPPVAVFSEAPLPPSEDERSPGKAACGSSFLCEAKRANVNIVNSFWRHKWLVDQLTLFHPWKNTVLPPEGQNKKHTTTGFSCFYWAIS